VFIAYKDDNLFFFDVDLHAIVLTETR